MDGTDKRIHLWLMRTDMIDDALQNALIDRLDTRERQAYQRLGQNRDRTLYSAAHALKRYALSQTASLTGPAINPGQWRFAENPNGKPFLSEPLDRRDLQFNLSHTPGLVAIAIAQGLALGLDVEWLDPTHANLDVASAFAHPTEMSALKPDAPDFIDQFYRLWTCKEALAKALGLGLALDVRRFNFEDEIAGVWHVEDWREDESHRIALVAPWHGTQHQLIIHRLTAGDILG
jgi:4'-phosphopantetheinyl transferase